MLSSQIFTKRTAGKSLRSTILATGVPRFVSCILLYRSFLRESLSFSQFGLIAVGFEKYSNEEELEKDAIKHLLEIYIKVNADAEKDPNVKIEAAKFFKRMEDGDESALVNWRKWRELSVKKYAEEYARLNVHFDEYIGESMVGKEWQAKAIERLEEMSLIEDHEGAKLVNLEKWKMGRAVLRKKGKSDALRTLFPANSTLQTALRSTSLAILAVLSSATRNISSTR